MNILNKFSLEGKVAVVTGASTGLGQGISLGLASAGAHIVGVDYVEMPETEEKVKALGKDFIGITANLLSIEPIQGIIDQAIEKFGKVDILVNNAGIIRRCDAIDNIKTVFFFSQAMAKQYIKQNSGGKIINIASMLSFQGGIRVPSYTSSKSGVMGVTRALANEWAKHNINVNAIAPGYMATNNTTALRADEDRSKSICSSSIFSFRCSSIH
ncbi:MAG: 2-deoxy-D-gluconate 3-dehydrogenase [Clostridia bacterium]|nr:2-deoxy-D-gluconate 3-dehydrogenase [Clostridia bacterium]